MVVAGVLGVHAHGIDGAVDADAIGEPAQGLDRVFQVEVDHFGALLAGHAQAVVEVVDGEHPGGTHQLGAGDGELTHWAAAEHRHRVAGVTSAISAPK